MPGSKWKTYRDDLPDGHRACTKCKRVLPYSEFHKHSGCHGGFNCVCKVCRKPTSREQFRATPIEKRLYNAAKSRAAMRGREFNIELSDVVIPAQCPVLKISMDSPSIDRIDSSKGYIKGNIRVISKRANTLKNNATTEELALVLQDARSRDLA